MVVRELKATDGYILEIAEVIARAVDTTAGEDGVAGIAVGLRHPRLQEVLHDERAGTDVVDAPVAIGIGNSQVDIVHQDVPAGQALVALVLDTVAVVVLKLEATEGHILEVAEVVAGAAHSAAGRDGVASFAAGLRPARLLHFLHGEGAGARLEAVLAVRIVGDPVLVRDQDMPAS